ncbi:MAG: transcriptional regulator [SAR86 cluster bacterium]|uniref:Transcriptional regulator n=1 Tax=SAR86 cluster bacterium TaxID=2030880 RepID=A0A2A4WXP3_9GAMM|nr:MAG: transcriptional regulator [SAR86 cluster bacterium]
MKKPKTIYSTEHERLCSWLNANKEESDVSIRQLAKKLGWSPAIVGKVFTGDRRLDVIEYVQVCQSLNIDAHEGLDTITKTTVKKKSKKKK